MFWEKINDIAFYFQLVEWKTIHIDVITVVCNLLNKVLLPYSIVCLTMVNEERNVN